jgi:YbgC/YbaW family acyl-CoA thioester hydrolase
MGEPLTTEPRSGLTLRRRVHFYELDSAGIVHFSCFFRYMEEAEHELWREAGISIAPRGADIGFPRVSATCDYYAPLRFEDEFDVHITIEAMTAKSIRYACLLTRGEVKIATGTIVIVCVRKAPDGTMKATEIPGEIARRFAVAASPAGAPATARIR